MAEITRMTLTVKDSNKINHVADVFKRTLKNCVGDTFRERGYEEFEKDLVITDNTLMTESSYAFTSYEFEVLLRKALINIASEVDAEFTFKADEFSDQCGYEAFTEADYVNGILTYKFIASENMMGYCEECGEDIVYYEEYDPSKTYVCPECGRELTEEEMFPDGVPTWEVEEIRIKH